MSGREPLYLVVQAVAEDPVSEGRRRRVGLVAPAYHRGLGRSPAVSHVTANDVGQLLHRARSHVGDAVHNGYLGCLDHRAGRESKSVSAINRANVWVAPIGFHVLFLLMLITVLATFFAGWRRDRRRFVKGFDPFFGFEPSKVPRFPMLPLFCLAPLFALFSMCFDVIILKVSPSYLNLTIDRIGRRNLYYSE